MTADDQSESIPGLTRLMYDMVSDHSLINRFNIVSDDVLKRYGLEDPENKNPKIAKDRELILKADLVNIRKRMKEQIDEWVVDDGVIFHIGYGYPLGPFPPEECRLPRNADETLIGLTYCVPEPQVNAFLTRMRKVPDWNEGKPEMRLVIGGKAFPQSARVEIYEIEEKDAGYEKKQILSEETFVRGRHSTYMHSFVQIDVKDASAVKPGWYRIRIYDKKNEKAEPIVGDIAYPTVINEGDPFYQQVGLN